MAKKVTRLYEQFQPEHYDVTLDVDRQAMRFSGTVTLRGRKVGRPAQRLTFHQNGLKISSATAVKHDKKGDQPVEIVRINNHDGLNELRLHAAGMIYPGDYSVTMVFNSVITTAMHGIYPGPYRHKGQAKMAISSQFESHYAREAFPCIDEPEAKATFDLTLVSPAGEVALSNMPAKTEKTKGDRLTTTFETTPRMSTYLLVFAFGEFHGVSGQTKDGVLVRSWATTNHPKSHLQYANDEAIRCLEFLVDYFQTPFPLPKLDQVAVSEFEALAMENWGLITFREVGLLADPKNRSLSGEQLISMVIAHELSHQWFGNLVTMKWWDDLWLNESFAELMLNIVLEQLHPEWHWWEEFATGRALGAAQRDVYKDVQSLSLEVSHPDEIRSLFDPAIVYGKGARLLNMLYDYVGEDNLKAGLKQYFKKNAYGNTTRHDLWKALGASSHQDIEALMTPWLVQSGQPLLSVSHADNKLQLSQKRFLLDGQDKAAIWPIPFLADRQLPVDILTKRSAEFAYASDEMPVFNAHGSGHFIVNYTDKAVRQQIRDKVAQQSVDTLGRITILNDLLLLAQAGESNLTEALEIVKASTQEPREAVWTMLSRALAFAQTLTDGDEPTEKRIRHFKQQVAAYWYERLGWVDKASDDPNTKHLRTTVLALSVTGENPQALAHALKLFDKAGSVEALPAEQRGIIAGAAVRHGQSGVADQLMKEYAAASNPEVRDAITVALCSNRNPDLTKQIIKWGLSPGGAVRQQDLDHWFAYLIRNRYSRDLAWQWLTGNWQQLAKLFGGGKAMEYFVWYAAGPLSTPEWEKRFRTFFEPLMSEPSLKRNIQVGLSEITSRITWRQREEAALKIWLKSNG